MVTLTETEKRLENKAAQTGVYAGPATALIPEIRSQYRFKYLPVKGERQLTV